MCFNYFKLFYDWTRPARRLVTNHRHGGIPRVSVGLVDQG